MGCSAGQPGHIMEIGWTRTPMLRINNSWVVSPPLPPPTHTFPGGPIFGRSSSVGKIEGEFTITYARADS